VSLDFTAAEARYGSEPFHALTPEKLFSRRWGLTLLDKVLSRLREDYARRGKAEVFDRLRVCLLGENDVISTRALAQTTAMSEGAVRVAVHRLRQQFRQLLRDEIAKTVENADDVEDEIRDLFAALGS
jgi:RNA polymerase sigma-70 factor (ECF subfamily)